MTAISVGTTPVPPPAVPVPVKSLSRSPFAQLLSDTEEPQVPGNPRDDKDSKNTPIAVPVVAPAPPKLILPLAFGTANEDVLQADSSKNAPQDSAAADEVIQPPLPPADAKASKGEVAFAARLIDTAPQPQQPQATTAQTAATPLPAVAKAALPKTAVELHDQPPTPTARNADAAQPGTAAEKPRESNASDLPPASGPAAVHTYPVADTPMVRDVASSSAASRSIETAPQPSTVDHVAPQPPQHTSTSPLNEITVRVANADQTSASIRMVDHAGELRVAVRSADSQLTDALRGNVEQLTSRLNTNGWSAEVWKPTAVTAAARTSSSSQEMTPGQQGSKNQDGGPSSRNQQNNKQQKYPDWVEEFYANHE